MYITSKMPRHSGGKLPAGMKKYPNIMAYLRTKHAAVADVLDDLFMSRALVPRAKTGRTFLVPDAALMKKITAALKSADPEEATDILSTLIITDYLPTVKEWRDRRDDIPNLLGKLVQVKNLNATKVELVAGSITPAKDYVPFDRSGRAKRGNTAVWLLKGEVPYGDDVPDAKGKYNHSEAVSGAMEIQSTTLLVLTDRVESKYEQYLRDPTKIRNPYQEVLAALAAYAAREGDQCCLQWIAACLCHGCEVAYYLVLQPYRSEMLDGKRIIKDSLLQGFIQRNYDTLQIQNPAEELRALVDSQAQSNEDRVARAREAIAQRCGDKGFMSVIREIATAYSNLGESNVLEDVADVMPDELADRVKEVARVAGVAPGQILAYTDERGFILWSKFYEVSAGRLAAEWPTLKSRIVSTGSAPDNVDPYNNTVFNNAERAKSVINPGMWFACGPLLFVRSSHFVNTNRSQGCTAKMGAYSGAAESPLEGGFVNRTERTMRGLSDDAESLAAVPPADNGRMALELARYVDRERIDKTTTVGELLEKLGV